MGLVNDTDSMWERACSGEVLSYNPPVAWKLTPITVSNDNGNNSVSSNALAGKSTPG
ncbi:hypothetical protein D3C84_1282830 [compost metagenome]